MLHRRFLPCLLAAAVSFLATAAHAAERRELRDVPYVTKGSAHQCLDLYLPGDDAPKHPVMVWIHGGGWIGGTKSSCPALELLAHGYVVVSVEYRFSNEAIYPAQIEDCKAAIRWLRAHAGEYRIDPDRIGTWGASAGGHLVALLGTMGNDKTYDQGENLDFSSKVQCVIDWFGPTDFLHWGTTPSESFPANAGSMVAKLLGGAIKDRPELAKAASPIYFITKDAPPFLIIHGDADPLVPLQQSQDFQAALEKAGVPSTLLVLPKAGHGGAAFGSGEVIKALAEFTEKNLRAK